MTLFICDIKCPRHNKMIAFCHEPIKNLDMRKVKSFPVPCKYLGEKGCEYLK